MNFGLTTTVLMIEHDRAQVWATTGVVMVTTAVLKAQAHFSCLSEIQIQRNKEVGLGFEHGRGHI